MRIRHAVIFTVYDTTTEAQIEDVINRLQDMGVYLTKNLGVNDWIASGSL